MSFRGRLTLFFILIVVVPMVSAAIVLFRLISDNEQGKAGAGLQARAEVAANYYRVVRDDAARASVAIGRDQDLADALRAGDRGRIRRAADAARRRAGADRVVVSRDTDVITDVGVRDASFPAARELVDGSGRDVGRLEVSTKLAGAYAREVARYTGSS